ncbi:hypothetical protein Hanom_Chr05g00400921 [Helianthus anomalus]
MLVLCTQNVIPRRGDKFEVRFAEVLVLYMLMHGSQLVPFRFLVLNKIWIGRNSGERKIVPHYRLITALLKAYGAIGAEDKGSYKNSNHGVAGPSGGVHGVGTQSGYIRSAFDYARQPYDPYWAHSGNMEQVVEQRPPLTFTDWSEPNQMLFDQQTYMGLVWKGLLSRVMTDMSSAIEPICTPINRK